MQDNTTQENQQDQPMTTLDLQQAIEQLKSEPAWGARDRHSLVLFKSATMRIVLVGMHEGSEIATHSAIGAITVQVVKGCMRFIAGEQDADMEEGKLITLLERVPHSVTALKETFFLLTIALKT